MPENTLLLINHGYKKSLKYNKNNCEVSWRDKDGNLIGKIIHTNIINLTEKILEDEAKIIVEKIKLKKKK